MQDTGTSSISAHLFFISVYKYPQKFSKDAELIYLYLPLKKTFRKTFNFED